MGYEIDFLAVGDGTKSGDAIAIRYGNLHGSRDEQHVIVIDGGFKDDGEKLVSHIREYYKTDKVDLVISTHPDADHINGLSAVLDNLDVSELWIHKAWEHNQGLAAKFQDGRITDNSMGERLKASLNQAHDLVSQAERSGVTVREPFAGLSSGPLKVLGPSVQYYEKLLVDFDGMPQARSVDEALRATNLFAEAWNKVEQVWQTIRATWGEDDIDDDDTTSAKNNSSVITRLDLDGKTMVFTGDAGIAALENATNQAVLSGTLHLIQIPHHGSRRNVGPAILNQLIGRPVAQEEKRGVTAIASAAKGGAPKHPHKAVLNAFTHRGVKVLTTCGQGICLSLDSLDRPGWSRVEPEPYYHEYEDKVTR